jgi:hypothetical protein
MEMFAVILTREDMSHPDVSQLLANNKETT